MNFAKKLVGVLLLIVTQLSVKIDGQTLGCGGKYSNPSGIISSPNYPSNYGNNMDCVYEIQSSPSHSVNIWFISFATENNVDWLQVSCTFDSTKPVQIFTGTDLPPFLSISSCDSVQLLFHTDGSVVRQGFSLRYDVGNGLPGGLTMKPMNLNVSSDSTGPIVLSCYRRANQPDVYPWWSYNSSRNRYVEILTTSRCSVSSSLMFLSSEYFNITREYSSRTCNLTISRFFFPSATAICTCTNSTLGFLIVLIDFNCGGTYSNLSGIISSPNYPSYYDDYLNCTYYIQSSPPDSVNITFISFATEFYNDWLQVSCTNDSTKPVQRFSGTNLPTFLSISLCSMVQLQFHTNGYVTAKGFSLRYDIGNGLRGGLTMKPMNLNVSSDSTDPVVLSCSSSANQPDVYPWWSYNSKNYPFVKILTTSNCSVIPSLRFLSSEYLNTTREYSSRTCNLTISRFYFPSAAGIYTCTDSTLDFFNALINFGCGGTYLGRSGIISSPNYPSNYGNNMDCSYNIQLSSLDFVNITFISFATVFSDDWLQVSCSNDSTKLVQRFSGTKLPPFLSISSCSVVQLQFHTNGYVTAKGFSLRYDIGNETGNNLNTLALIVGVVVGIAVLLIFVAIVGFFCLRRKKILKTHPAATTIVQPQYDNPYEMNRRSTLNANEGEISAYEMLGIYDTISIYETISTNNEAIDTYETIN